MPPVESLAESIADALFATIEREKRISRADFVATIEPLLAAAPVPVDERPRRQPAEQPLGLADC